ncbi:MAG: VanZ family protein, partial [Planctomycetota bacterium]|nr:VanZ family protein [Planctomycetota bacterium]
MHARFLTVWFASVFVLTLSPFGPIRSPLPFSWIDPTTHRLGLFDFYANVLLFLPLGVFAGRTLTRRGTVILGIAFSMLIESAQALIVGRNPSAWDVMANSLGAGLGVYWSASLLALGKSIYTRPVR